MAKIENLFKTKTAKKRTMYHTLWGCTYLYRPYINGEVHPTSLHPPSPPPTSPFPHTTREGVLMVKLPGVWEFWICYSKTLPPCLSESITGPCAALIHTYQYFVSRHPKTSLHALQTVWEKNSKLVIWAETTKNIFSTTCPSKSFLKWNEAFYFIQRIF